MLTQCGPRCDVCSNYILPGINESINPFKMNGILNELHACDKCAAIVKAACAVKDWKLLPEGPLKKVFQDQESTPKGE